MSKPNAAKRKRREKARIAAARANVSHYDDGDESGNGNDRNVSAPSAARATTVSTATTADAFDRWLTSLWTMRIASVTLAIAVCVAVLFAFLLNAKERTLQVYESAPICASESTANCVILLDATISGKTETGGKTPHQYFLTLAGPVPASGQIAILRYPVWDGMNVGDTVTATVWNGEVVRIADGAIVGNTSSAPSIQTATFAALLASAIVWVVTFALFAVRVFEAGRGRALGWSRALIPVNPAMGVSVFVFPFGSIAGAGNGSTPEAVLIGVGGSALAGSYFVVNWIWIRKRHFSAEVA